jgi:hypothetical protein
LTQRGIPVVETFLTVASEAATRLLILTTGRKYLLTTTRRIR